jgi:5-(carboxyamino)imidazole ribonucleotide mutase
MASVLILIGSKTDEAVMQSSADYLSKLGITNEMRVSSAHRQPDETATMVKRAEKDGFKVIIAAAGMAAHLPGFCASLTTLPVIGVPLAGSDLNGMDALMSIVQMPAGVPVATVSIGSAGAKNAAVLAAEILALSDRAIQQKLAEFRMNGSKF